MLAEDGTIKIGPEVTTNAYQFTVLQSVVPPGAMQTQQQKATMLGSGTSLIDAVARFKENVLDTKNGQGMELVSVALAGKLEF